MNNENKRQTLYEGATVLLFSTVLVKIIGALFKIPLSADYCLGDLGFGYFSAAHDFFTPIHMIAISGFPVAVSKMVADFIAKKQEKDAKNTFLASRSLLIGFSLLFSLVLAIIILLFLKFTDKTGLSMYSYFAMLPCVFFCFTASSYRGYYEGLGNMNPAAISNIIEALGKLILGFSLAFIVVRITGNAAYAAASAVAGITIGSFFSLLYLHIRYKTSKEKIIKQALAPQSKNELMKAFILISVPIVLSSLSSGIVTLIDSITVRWNLSDNIIGLGYIYPEFAFDLESLPTLLYGIRSKAFTIYNLIPTLTMAVGVGAVPVIASAFVEKKEQEVAVGFSSVLKLSALISFPAAAGFIALGGRIMSLLYGKGISADIGGKILLIYGVSVIFAGICIPLGSCLQAIGRQKAALINVAVGVLVKLVGNIALCSNMKINIFGSAYSTLACYLVIFILHFALIVKVTGKPRNIKNSVLKPFIAALMCGVSAYLISLISDSSFVTAIAIFVAAVVYITVLSLLNTFEEGDIISLPYGQKLLKICKRAKIIR